MTQQDRVAYFKYFLSEYCAKVTDSKGPEYSRGEVDVNSNFKRTAEATGIDPLQVCYIFMAKHLDSIANYIKNRPSNLSEPIEGRIGDAINYLLILASLIKEQENVFKSKSHTISYEISDTLVEGVPVEQG